jgi:glycerate 2-kinase
MHILIAPNAFKNSLAADMVAEAINKGLLESKLLCSTTSFPVGDGGDGTTTLLIRHLQGKIINKQVHDPIGRQINSCFGLTDNNQTAIIELADASGLKLLQRNEYDPLHTTTYGTGELINYALEKNAKKIILCIGGSATVDAGVGILQALGVKFIDDKGNELKQLPASLSKLADINTINLDRRLANTELIILCDVENKLLGENGAAAVFGPQKGASKEDIQQLEAGLTRLCNLVLQKTGIDMAALKHGGAAGGVAAGLHTLLNAKLVNGIDYFLDITGFDKALEQADIVITGEGSIDEQTLRGKAPFGIAKRAKERSIVVIGIAGNVPLKMDEQLQKYFDVLLPVSNEVMDIKIAIKNTYANLVRSAKLIGDLLNIHA